MISMREVARKAKAVQDLMHDERETLPWEFWEVGQIELTRFAKAAWPTVVSQKQ